MSMFRKYDNAGPAGPGWGSVTVRPDKDGSTPLVNIGVVSCGRASQRILLDTAQVHDLMDQLQAIVEPEKSRVTRPSKPLPNILARQVVTPRVVEKPRIITIPNATLKRETPTEDFGGFNLELKRVAGQFFGRWMAGERWWFKIDGKDYVSTNLWDLPCLLRARADLVARATDSSVVEERTIVYDTVPSPTTPGVSGEDFRS